jgi:hypothetical protein
MFSNIIPHVKSAEVLYYWCLIIAEWIHAEFCKNSIRPDRTNRSSLRVNDAQQITTIDPSIWIVKGFNGFQCRAFTMAV